MNIIPVMNAIKKGQDMKTKYGRKMSLTRGQFFAEFVIMK